jgi:3-oxoacyl-[acyl-carrier protein] reductase
MKGIALELGPHGIRVNMIEPGLAPGSAGTAFPPGYLEAIANQIPLGRLIESGEAADAAVFLASDAARFITGTSLAVDGGGGIPHRQVLRVET